MADLRVKYDEEVVGAGHPTKDDTLNRLVIADHANDGGHRNLGHLAGLDLDYKDSDEVTVRGGSIEINGKTYYLSSAVDITLSGLGADTWYAILVEAPSNGAALAAGQFSFSSSMPSWDNAKVGFYDAGGSKRLVGLVLTDSSGNIIPFSLVDRMFLLANWHNFHDASSGNATSFTLIGTGAPALGVVMPVLIHGSWISPSAHQVAGVVGAECIDTYTPAKHAIGAESDSTDRGAGEVWAMTNASQQVKYACDSATVALKLYLKGFILNR